MENALGVTEISSQGNGDLMLAHFGIADKKRRQTRNLTALVKITSEELTIRVP